MKTNYKKSFLGSIIAFVVGTSCLWLTPLAIWFGGATVLTLLSGFVHEYNSIILSVAILFFLIGVYQFWRNRKSKKPKNA